MRLISKRGIKLATVVLVGVTFLAGTLVFFNVDGVAIHNELSALDLIPKPEKLTELYFNDNANLPGSQTNSQITGTYQGTMYDVSSNVSKSLSLTGLQQSQGRIAGNLVMGSKQPERAPFSGTIDAASHLQLIVRDTAANTTYFFEGQVESSTSLSGHYYQCIPGSIQNSSCSRATGNYGIWSLALTMNFAFVIHNLETTDYQYIYQVSVNLNGIKHVVDSGKVQVKNNQYYVKREEFSLIKSSGHQEVVVELINNHQLIDFWVQT